MVMLIFILIVRIVICPIRTIRDMGIFMFLISHTPLISAGEMLTWTESEIGIISSLSLHTFPENPPLALSNPYGDHKDAKDLGKRLFFDPGLSVNGKIACSTCHNPELNFTDGHILGQGIATLTKNTPTLFGAAYQQWFYIDGRRDSLWAQALTPIETLIEMGLTRVEVVKYVLSHSTYQPLYNAIFGPVAIDIKKLPKKAGPFGDQIAKKNWRYFPPNVKHQVNHIFANIGRVIAAYERDIMPPTGRLEIFLKKIKYNNKKNGASFKQDVLTYDEQLGLKLFIHDEKTQCLRCHNGPLLTNREFHNIGTATLSGKHLDLGRMIGLQAVLGDTFNCFGKYSGVNQSHCAELQHVNTRDSHSALLGSFKVPTLRGLSKTAPYGHNGQFATLEDMVKHYNNPPNKDVYNHELLPLSLSDVEIKQLVAFLKIL